jgi:alkylation response protein AidB-like acyl-CoA dehydrogenase
MDSVVATVDGSVYVTQTGRRIRDEVAALVPLIRKNALAGERAGEVPAETLQALTKTGLFRVSVPLEQGGLALGARDLAEIVSEVARGDGSTAWITMIASGFARVMLTFSERAIAEVYRASAQWPGPLVAGASLFSEKVQRGRRVEGGYIVNAGGKWAFGSGCKHAAFVCVGIEYELPDGDKRRGMALLESNQYTIVDDWKVMGLSASSSNSVSTSQDVFVPEYRFVELEQFPARLDSIAGRFGGAGYRLNGLGLMLYVAMETMAIPLGMARGALECFIEQVKARKPFNLPYAMLSDMPTIQVAAAKARAMISAAQALIFSRADQLDYYGHLGQAITPAEDSEFMMDFAYAGSLCGQAIDMLQLAIGSSTVAESNPIQRFARDARVALTHGSTRLDPVAEINGRSMLGLAGLGGFAPSVPGVPGQQSKKN